MTKRERIYFRVDKGCLIPADSYAASKIRERGYDNAINAIAAQAFIESFLEAKP